jgi:hypothetical protein
MTLVETGTRALIGAVFGPTAEGETSYAGRLLHLLSPDMLLLWDRGSTPVTSSPLWPPPVRSSSAGGGPTAACPCWHGCPMAPG